MMYDVLLPSFIAGVVSYQVSSSLGVHYFYHPIAFVPDFSELLFIKVFVSGILFGLGSLFLIEAMLLFKHISAKIKIWGPLKAALAGVVLILLTFALSQDYLGLGLNTIEGALEGEKVVWWGFAAKVLFTSITLTFGCSGGLSAGWEYLAGTVQRFQAMHGTRPPWESCCIKHDRAYHRGGEDVETAARSFAARKHADLELKVCVLETGMKRIPELSAKYNISAREVERLYSAIAELMYRAVRVGGMPCTGLPWRWGYGWPRCK